MGTRSLWASGVSQDSQNDLGVTMDLPAGNLSATKFRKLPTDAPIMKVRTASTRSASFNLCFPQDEPDIDYQILHREIIRGVKHHRQLRR